MSEELPADQQIEDLRSELTALDEARSEALERYIDSLDEDEGDLAYGAEDENRETLVTEITAALDSAETLLSDLDGIDEEMPEAERSDLVRDIITTNLNAELSNARETLVDLREDLKKDGIEPKS